MNSKTKKVFWIIYFTALLIFGAVYFIFRDHLSLIDWILFIFMVVLSPLAFLFFISSESSNTIKEEVLIETKNIPTRQELEKFAKFQNWKLIESNDHWIIKTPLTLSSWGEIITVYKLTNNGNFKLKIISKPRLETTFHDYGKNKKNLITIQRFFTAKILSSEVKD